MGESTKQKRAEPTNRPVSIAVSKGVLLASFTQQVVQITTSIEGLMNIDTTHAVEKDRKTMFIAGHGIIYAALPWLFIVLRYYVSDKPKRLYQRE